MRKILLASTAIAALTAPALAADLLARTAPAPVPAAPIFTWTGFYAGGNAGYLGIAAKTCEVSCDTARRGGIAGGIQAGYNLQTGSFVVGLEADIAAAGATASKNQSIVAVNNRVSAIGTVRARLGFAINRTLFYVSGGLAYADVRNEVTSTLFDPRISSGWRAGWALGGGVEYAFAPHWTARAELLRYDLGQAHYGANPYAFKTRNDGALARVGVNYKF